MCTGVSVHGFRVNVSITDVFALITSKRSIVIRSIGIQIRFLICEMDRGIDEKKSKGIKWENILEKRYFILSKK